MEKQIDKINQFIKTCESFSKTIFANGIWSLNDGVNAPKYIDKNTAEWRIFNNNVDLFLDKRQYANWKVEFHNIVDNRMIDKECVDDLRVFFSTLVGELESIGGDTEEVVQNESKETTPFKQLVEDITIIKSRFSETGGNGIPRISTIRDDSLFIEWISKLQFELQQLKQDPFVKDILKLT